MHNNYDISLDAKNATLHIGVICFNLKFISPSILITLIHLHENAEIEDNLINTFNILFNCHKSVFGRFLGCQNRSHTIHPLHRPLHADGKVKFLPFT